MSSGEFSDGIIAAARRQPLACIAGLFAGWSGLFVALWLAFVFGIAGAIGGALELSFLTSGIGQAVQGFIVTGAASGFLAGFLAGFIAIFGATIGGSFWHLAFSLMYGVALAIIITSIAEFLEPLAMDFRQFRRPSRRAEEGKLIPLLSHVAYKLGYRAMPPIRIQDSPIPGAWMHVRHMVISRGLVDQMDEEELAAVMAHELHHWHKHDAVALRLVWACALPMILLVNLYSYAIGRRVRNVVELGVGQELKQGEQALLAFAMAAGRATIALLLFLLWPAIALTRLLIMPAMMAQCRKFEYEADAAAIAAGFGPGLAKALTKLQDFETPRTGWEEALLRTHPPIEFRLEAIEEALAAPPRATRRGAAAKATSHRIH
jgi:Zn-dependent protease with chaperone function